MKLLLKNFQSHKKTLLRFKSPGVNVLWGLSMAGKSAIVRAMRKLFLNKPAGFPYMRDGTKKSLIEALGIKYFFGKQAIFIHDKTKYRKFGRLLPEEIQNVFNMGEVNFQFQHDKPYFFGNPASTARAINEITGQEEINRLLKAANKEVRTSGERVKILDSRLRRLRKEKKHYKRLRSLRAMLIKAKRQFNEVIELKEKKAIAQKALIELDQLRHDKKLYRKIVAKIEEKQGEISVYRNAIRELADKAVIAEDLWKMQKKKKRLKKKANRLHKKLDKIMGERCPLCKEKR